MTERILFVMFQSGRRSNGGIESISQIILRLTSFRPMVISQVETPALARLRERGVEVDVWQLPYRHNESARAAGIYGVLARVRSLAKCNLKVWRLLRKKRIGIVHFNDIQAQLHGALGARLAGSRVVLSLRDTKPEGSYGWGWRLAVRLSHKSIALSNEMASELRAKLARSCPEKVIHIYSAIDFANANPSPDAKVEARRILGLPVGVPVVLMAGAISAKKGHLEVIQRSLPSLIAALPSAQIYFVGDFYPDSEVYSASCLNAVKDLGLESCVRFVGYDSRIHLWYEASDVTLIASTHEGLARAMIESLAHGTPVVSFDVSSAREVIGLNNCGAIVGRGEFEALAEEAIKLLINTSDRQQLSRRARETAAKLFDPKASIEAYQDVYRGLLK